MIHYVSRARRATVEIPAILFWRFDGETQPRNSLKRFKRVDCTRGARTEDGTGSLSWHFIENHEISRVFVITTKISTAACLEARISWPFFSLPLFSLARFSITLKSGSCHALLIRIYVVAMRCDTYRRGRKRRGYLGDLLGASLENGSTPFTVKGRQASSAAEEQGEERRN